MSGLTIPKILLNERWQNLEIPQGCHIGGAYAGSIEAAAEETGLGIRPIHGLDEPRRLQSLQFLAGHGLRLWVIESAIRT
jgi:hypothetical protein